VTFEELVAAFQALKGSVDEDRAAQAKELAQLRRERDEARHERDELRKLNELLSLELERTRRHLFGRKSEAVDPAQRQLALLEVAQLLGTLETSGEGKDSPEAEPRRRKQRKQAASPHGRQVLPEHLPVHEITLLPPEVQGPDADSYVRIGEEVDNKLEWRPASQVRVRIVRPKFERKGERESGVCIADVLDTPIARGLAGPGLLAKVVVSKYCDHLPWHRQTRMFAREGVHIPRSTLCGWSEQLYELLSPLVDAMWKDSLLSEYIAVDATGVLVQSAEQCRRGHFWVLVAERGHVLFRYTRKVNKVTVSELLGGYKGYLQADAATVYDLLYRDTDCQEVGCWAHCRRRFFDAMTTDQERARRAIGFIRRLYEIDEATADLPRERRTKDRAERAAPVLEAFFRWVEAESLQVLPFSPIGKACTYARNQKTVLARFVDDGRLRLDNNWCERELRRQAVGRKNWLFVASDDGAKWNAVFVSLIASCELHKLEPWAYLRDLLCLVPDWPKSRLLELSPKHWHETLQNTDAQKRLAAHKLRDVSLVAAPANHADQTTSAAS
jgi:transposase